MDRAPRRARLPWESANRLILRLRATPVTRRQQSDHADRRLLEPLNKRALCGPFASLTGLKARKGGTENCSCFVNASPRGRGDGMQRRSVAVHDDERRWPREGDPER